jgi:hypothetical protein
MSDHAILQWLLEGHGQLPLQPSRLAEDRARVAGGQEPSVWFDEDLRDWRTGEQLAGAEP